MESGAKAAISGFRLQALHTLDLILRDASSSREFQPEGKEDLAIYENARLIKAIQVKAYSAPLTLSDLFPRKETSLLRRLLNSEDKSSAFELTSFGPLGPELEAFQRREDEALAKFSRKLREYGYSNDEVAELARRLQIVKVDEATVRQRVHGHFTQTLTAGDPARALDLLVWWVLQAAENRYRITYRDLRDRLLAVGRYFAERRDHHEEWFTTIKPLEDLPASTLPSIDTLATEYYRGTAARYAHIRAGLDVRRDELLTLIDDNLRGKKVVIVHGASGQGKTSLLLRYLHDYVPEEWRFMVTAIDDRRHASKIANALADHLRAVNVPVFLLIDVAPRDLQWVALIRELLDIENVRILVAIREEDLARRTASESEIGFPADIRLDFTETEAANVYARLVTRGDAVNAFPTFNEAWHRFGGDGPLLEFVYLITQTASLRSVLASQVRRLREEVRSGTLAPEALRFLHICAAATSFEAHVRLAPLAAHLGLKDPIGIVALFENEYLLRVSADRAEVEALHPVRSGLLALELQDPVLAPAEELALQGLPFIPENDLEVFLLYLLSRHPNCWARLPAALAQLPRLGWTGGGGIGRVLLWWGTKCYLEENRPTIEEARNIASEAWAFLVLPDVAGALGQDPAEGVLDLLGRTNPAVAEMLRRIRSHLTPRSRLFEPITNWLLNTKIATEPSDLSDWEGLAELTFWAGRLNIPVPGTFELADLPVGSLPLSIQAQICLALAEADPTRQAQLLRLHGEALRTRFREDTESLILTESGETVTAEFLVPFDLLADSRTESPETDGAVLESVEILPVRRTSTATRQGPRKESLDAILNNEAVRRAELLHGFFPDKEQYCTQGHGHQLTVAGVELPHDSTRKQMPPTALPAPWLVRVNATLHSLEAFGRRPDTWNLYAELLLSIRETIATVLLQLHRALSAYFENNSARSLFGSTLTTELWEQAKQAAGTVPHLPMSAVDEWGLSSETQRDGSAKASAFSTNIASTFALGRHRAFAKAMQDYTFAISNFLSQAEILCVVHGMIGRNIRNKSEVIALATAQYGYGEDKIRLSKHNLFQVMICLSAMQRAFNERVGHLADTDKLIRVAKRETNLFPELWALWYQFCDFPEKRMQAAGAQSVSEMEEALALVRKELKRSLTSPMWSVVMIRDRFVWQGRPAMVLCLDLTSLTDLEAARADVLARLGEMLEGARFGSLVQYALEYYWPNILIIPRLAGVAPESGAWVVPSFVFSHGGDRENPDRPWLRVLQPLSQEQMETLGVEVSRAARIESLNALQECLGKVHLHFAHLALLAKLSPRLDEVGISILDRYLAASARQLTQEVDNLRNLLPRAVGEVEQSTWVAQEILEVLLEPIKSLRTELEGLEDRRLTPDLQRYDAEARRFQELASSLVVLRWMSVPGAIGAGDIASGPS